MRRGLVVAIGGAWILGCGGLVELPEPDAGEPDAGEPDWIEPLIPRALEWEVMPGTTAEEDPERPAQLRAFFEAHPEYRDEALQAELADLACAFGVEEGHRRRVHPDPVTPVVVDVSGEDWRVMVAHAPTWCTSDDWGFYTSEVGAAASERGIAWGDGGPAHPELVVRRDGAEVGRAPLDQQGYLMWAAGRQPAWAAHDVAPVVLEAADRYFGGGDGGQR